jgi:hypothetical protein
MKGDKTMKKHLLKIPAIILALALLMTFVPVNAEDSTSIVINSTLKGSINTGQKIWYDLIVPEDGSISFSLTAAKQFCYVNMYLCNKDMYDFNFNNSHDKWTFIVWNFAIGASSAAEMSFDHLKAGKYYVVLRADPCDLPGKVDTTSFSLTCNFTPSLLKSDIEPNDTVETAQVISPDYKVTGNISYEEGYDVKTDFYDWYKFTIDSKGTLDLTFEAVPGQYGDIYELKVFKAGATDDAKWLSLDFTGCTGTVTSRKLENLEPGIYYIKLKGWHSYYSSYNLSLSFDGVPIPLKAVPTRSAVLVNGKNTPFGAYNINGYNYFKLRDLAFVASGTQKQFEVGWDGTNNAIILTSGKPYTPVGGEMALPGDSLSKQATATTSKIYIDGKQVTFIAYKIDGYNYFKLRDIAAAFDIGVTWDGSTNTIGIDTSIGYTAP